MSSPFTGSASDATGDEGVVSGSSPLATLLGGFDIDDPALAGSIQAGMQRVDALLHESLHSDLEFATRTSLHLVDAGGKRFRPLFTLLAAQFGDPNSEEVTKSAAVVEMVHLATLYHDDVMDEATMRRGARSANARWDNSVAILTGDFLFSKASRMVADLGTGAVSDMAETFTALVTGQMRETVGLPEGAEAVEHYLRVIDEKTASLIATAGRFGAFFSGAEQVHVRALDEAGRLLGAAFQISDDIIDIASPATESGKSPGTDLREGVHTLPMLFALADRDTDPTLRRLLSGPLETNADVEEALRLLRESDGLAQARRTLDRYANQAREEIAVLPDISARSAIAGLADYVVARTR